MTLLAVAVGVILGPTGDILLAKRQKHKTLAGLWEFPGGKVEAGELPYQALCRELDEEVGITVHTAEPLIQIQHSYMDRGVALNVWLVRAFAGDAYGREGQEIRWVPLDQLDDYPVPDANRPIIAKLRACV